MCIQIVERYAACHCLYHRHAVDACAATGLRGHQIQERTVYVGYKCPQHSSRESCHLDVVLPHAKLSYLGRHSSSALDTHHLDEGMSTDPIHVSRSDHDHEDTPFCV